MINGLYAVTLRSSDFKKLAKFYSDVIGLPVVQETSDSVFLKLGEQQRLLIQEDPNIKPVTNAQEQIRGYLAFEVASLESAIQRLKQKRPELQFLRKDKGAGFEVLTGRDPDGNRIDFVQPAANGPRR